MRILITGVNGFIGQNICRSLLLDSNNKIYGIGRKSGIFSEDIEYIIGDISNDKFISDVSQRIQNCDIIIHCAACIDKNDFNTEIIKINCIGTQNVVKAAVSLNVKKIIYISSIPVIGKPQTDLIDESHPAEPESIYHASKLMGENIVLLSNKYGILPVVFRIPSPVGIGMNSNTILSNFIIRCIRNEEIEIFGSGKRVQNYLDVRDICKAINLSINKSVFGVFNIASENSYSNIEIANICKKMTYSSSEIIFNGKPDKEEDYRWNISIRKAKMLLDFEPMYSIQDTIETVIKEFII